MSIPKAPVIETADIYGFPNHVEKQRDVCHTYYTEGDGYKAIKAEIAAEFVKWLKEDCTEPAHYYMGKLPTMKFLLKEHRLCPDCIDSLLL